MSGHHEQPTGEGEGVPVDATLEGDLAAVEQSVAAYLKDPSVTLRHELLAVLERLDQQIDLSDAYESGVIGSGALGFSSKGSVIGETSNVSPAEIVPESLLRAQTALVKAAKREVTAPTPGTLAGLRAAHQALVHPAADTEGT